MNYSIDTSAILEAWRRAYPPDVFPALWEGFRNLIRRGTIRATEEVFHELQRKDDEVCEWFRGQLEFFVPIDEPIQLEVQAILARFPKLLDTRKNRSAADPFVIALGRIHDAAVVTSERRTGTPSRPNIPDVCDALGVRTISILDLIREQGWVFRTG